MTMKVVVLVADGFEEIEAVTPVDVLRRAGCQVTVSSLSGPTATGAHGLGIQADVELSYMYNEFDALILPGGMPGAEELGKSRAVKALATRMASQNKLIASICAAPVYTLGAWGLLDNRSATCYPGMETGFPPTVRFREDRVVVDGNIVTSRGPGTALEFSLTLAAILVDENTARSLAQSMLLRI